MWSTWMTSITLELQQTSKEVRHGQVENCVPLPVQWCNKPEKVGREGQEGLYSMPRNAHSYENGKFDKFGKIGDLTKARRKDLDLREQVKEGGYQESSEFDENGEFGEIGDLTKFHQKNLDLRERAKERGIRKVTNLMKTAKILSNPSLSPISSFLSNSPLSLYPSL